MPLLSIIKTVLIQCYVQRMTRPDNYCGTNNLVPFVNLIWSNKICKKRCCYRPLNGWTTCADLRESIALSWWGWAGWDNRCPQHFGGHAHWLILVMWWRHSISCQRASNDGDISLPYQKGLPSSITVVYSQPTCLGSVLYYLLDDVKQLGPLGMMEYQNSEYTQGEGELWVIVHCKSCSFHTPDFLCSPNFYFMSRV